MQAQDEWPEVARPAVASNLKKRKRRPAEELAVARPAALDVKKRKPNPAEEFEDARPRAAAPNSKKRKSNEWLEVTRTKLKKQKPDEHTEVARPS